jgi:hypothetical protein
LIKELDEICKEIEKNKNKSGVPMNLDIELTEIKKVSPSPAQKEEYVFLINGSSLSIIFEDEHMSS